MQKTVFWIEHNYHLYSALSLLARKTTGQDGKIIFYIKKDKIGIEKIPVNVEVRYIDDYRVYIGDVFDVIFKKYFVNVSFSSTYYRKFFYKKNKINKWYLIFNKIFSFKKNIN